MSKIHTWTIRLKYCNKYNIYKDNQSNFSSKSDKTSILYIKTYTYKGWEWGIKIFLACESKLKNHGYVYSKNPATMTFILIVLVISKLN